MRLPKAPRATSAHRYRRISIRIWNDKKFRELSRSAQLLFLYILTHPQMTSLGAMSHTVEGLRAERRVPMRRFRRDFKQLIDRNLVEFDAKSNVLAAPNFLRHNPPESPNAVKSWPKWLDLLPDCELTDRVIQRSAAFIFEQFGRGGREHNQQGFVDALPQAFREAVDIPITRGFPKAIRKTIANTDPEPNPEPDPDRARRDRSGVPEGSLDAIKPAGAHAPARARISPRDVDGFLSWFRDQWSKHQGGACYVATSSDRPLVRELLTELGASYADPVQRLRKLALVMLTTSNSYFSTTPRNLRILRSQIQQLEAWLAEAGRRRDQRVD